MIQLYAKVSDLKPTEPAKLEYKGYFNDPDETILLANDMDCVKAFKDSIEKEGFKYALVVDQYGTICDGNCRYWCAVALNIEYVPINVNYFFGADKSFYPKKEVK